VLPPHVHSMKSFHLANCTPLFLTPPPPSPPFFRLSPPFHPPPCKKHEFVSRRWVQPHFCVSLIFYVRIFSEKKLGGYEFFSFGFLFDICRPKYIQKFPLLFPLCFSLIFFPLRSLSIPKSENLGLFLLPGLSPPPIVFFV